VSAFTTTTTAIESEKSNQILFTKDKEDKDI
jgi:hypothetical protein